MSYQNIASDLVMDLSTQEQELLCGGYHHYDRDCYDRDCDYHPPRRRRRGRVNVIVSPIIYVGNRRRGEDYSDRDRDRDR